MVCCLKPGELFTLDLSKEHLHFPLVEGISLSNRTAQEDFYSSTSWKAVKIEKMDVSDSQGDIVRPAAKNPQSETPCGLHLGFGGSSKPRVEGFVYSYHDYTWYDNRIRSFYNWPKTHPMRAQTLAGAGFHCTGKGDTVRCKWCDLELSGKSLTAHWSSTRNILVVTVIF